MDVHRAVRISQKLQKTPHGHHVPTLEVVVAVEEEEELLRIEESSVSVLSMSEEVER